MVHNHLKRTQEELYFSTDGGETDFVVKEGMTLVRRIQVWYGDLDKMVIPERELAPFSQLEAEAAECLLLTNDLETEIDAGLVRVRCMPVVKYLLLAH